MAGPVIDVGTVVVSTKNKWIFRGISIYVRGSAAGPLAGYMFQLIFLDSGFEIYSIPDKTEWLGSGPEKYTISNITKWAKFKEPDIPKNWLTMDDTNYIRVPRCQVNPNPSSHPQLQVIGLPYLWANRSSFPKVVATAEYSTRVSGSALMFELNVAGLPGYGTIQKNASQTDTSGYHTRTQTGEYGIDVGADGPGIGYKGSSSDTAIDPQHSNTRGLLIGSQYPDLRTIQLRQIGVPRR